MRWVQSAADSREGAISVPPNFWRQLKCHLRKCRKAGNRLVAFPFGFSCVGSNGHANILIYDTITHTLQRFDPEGGLKSSSCVNSDVDGHIRRLFDAVMGRDFIRTYVPPDQSMDFQRRQEAEGAAPLPSDPPFGFCTSWVCFFADFRLSHPDLSPTEAARAALSFVFARSRSLTQFIRDYSAAVATCI